MSTIFPRLRNAAALAAVVALLAVSGCETAPDTPERGEYTTSESGIQRAEQLVREAGAATSPRRDQLLLEAADIFMVEGRIRKAGNALARIDAGALTADGKLLFTLVNGELALTQRDRAAARDFIEASDNIPGVTSQPAEVRLRWHRARGEILALLGKPERSVFALTRASPLLPADGEEKRHLHDRIWQQLGELTGDELKQGADQSADADVAGWYQLADIFRRSRTDISQLIGNVQRWQRANPQHPAARVPPGNLRRLAALDVTGPANIAVLLPQEGELAAAGETLTDGIVAAYYDALDSGGTAPALRFHNTGAGDIGTIYQQAVDAGAELVIGPLHRDNLARLLDRPELPIPVLGLNYLEDESAVRPNLYQFGLSIRDEARQVAEQGRERGHRRALVITPDGGMGPSASGAFADRWLAQGGDIIATIRYSSADRDYTKLLNPFLLLDQSQQRATRLERLLGKNLDTTPRRRGDLDMVMLVSYPEQGRQIKPALDFLYAGDLPIFSTSHIYSGSPNPELDQDLDGITFTAMPWTIHPPDSAARPRSNQPLNYRNLFAMGMDAYRLHQWLEVLKTLPDNDIRGQTGNLSLIDGNRVRRTLPWARFENGAPVPEMSVSVGRTR